MNSRLSEAWAGERWREERWTEELRQELNLRLFCDMEREENGFPGKILWVEKITVCESGKPVTGGGKEIGCRERRFPGNKAEKAYTGQIKYTLKQFKKHLTKFWKKKRR